MRRSQIVNDARTHIERIRTHYEKSVGLTKAAQSCRDILAGYYNLFIPASASVLEVRCWTGDLLSRLRVTSKCGVDLSKSQIRLARERNRDGKFFVPAGKDLDLPEATFDCIILSETIKLADVQRVFERLYGETNIQRWKHGWLLLRLVAFAAIKLKFV
jgi:SAM-dependent methyltransferase